MAAFVGEGERKATVREEGKAAAMVARENDVTAREERKPAITGKSDAAMTTETRGSSCWRGRHDSYDKRELAIAREGNAMEAREPTVAEEGDAAASKNRRSRKRRVRTVDDVLVP